MKDNLFKISVGIAASTFTLAFSFLAIPSFIQNPDIIGAFGQGFVNPYASAYAIDTFCCWAILVFWIIYEFPKVKYGWVCIFPGIIPGVAVGFALYLILRTIQFKGS